MIRYEILTEHINDDTLGKYETYGITVYNNDRVIRLIGDITCDREKAAALAELFNKEQPGSSQLDEIIEQFLYTLELP